MWSHIRLRSDRGFSLNYKGVTLEIYFSEKYSDKRKRGAMFEVRGENMTFQLPLNYGRKHYFATFPNSSFTNLKPEIGGVLVLVKTPNSVKTSKRKLENKVQSTSKQ